MRASRELNGEGNRREVRLYQPSEDEGREGFGDDAKQISPSLLTGVSRELC